MVPDANDADLLQAWSAGDHEAAAVLVRRHTRDLYRFFVTRAPDDVDDLLQQTLLECVEHSRRGLPIGNFRALLFTIARRRLVDHVRKHQRRNLVELDTETVHALVTAPSQKLARARDERIVLEALRGLPLDSQIVLELFYWQELTGPDLARIMDIPEGTLRGRLRSARQQLARRVEELQGTTTSLRDTLSRLAGWKAGPPPAGSVPPVPDGP